MSATVIRAEPGAQELRQLGLRSAALGKLRYPLPASGAKTRDVYSADGDLRAVVDGNTDQQEQGRCCVTVHGGSLFGLLPADGTGAGTWFSVPTSELEMTTEGSQGFMRKRPTHISLRTERFDLTLSDVDKLLLNLEKYQAGQENALLTALRR